ncbi:MAG TPA: hypoxanthine phosphoribosyltransferase [Candidatus Marinimicrobia bacterium]|nr:hypoxanthine phosphoribosyltransferase [Candidatus Neomarinimicrobiota bacterium]
MTSKTFKIEHKGDWSGMELDCLFSDELIQKRVLELGQQISHDYVGAEKPPIMIGVLNGSLFFMADLMRAIDIEVEMDFIKIASYHRAESTGTVRLIKDISAQITGRDIIIVEDIIDSGLSMNFLRRRMLGNEPSSLRVATFLYKKEVSKLQEEPDYVGFVIPNRYVIGYGLDLEQQYRQLRAIYAFRDEDLEKIKEK